MLGVEDYGSGSESEREDSAKSITNANAERTLLTALPAPKATGATVIATSKAKRPKKITIGLPSLPASVDNEYDEPPAKRARTTGSGASSLLSILPAPKQAAPVPQRVLGGKSGPGLVFNSSRSIPSQSVNDQETSGTIASDRTSDSTSTSLLPPSLAKGKANISLENELNTSSKLAVPRKPSSVDFFALGASTR
jgi:proline-rich protein PRCC